MTERNTAKGRCLCGAVAFTAHPAQCHVGACHCKMCRKWGGGPYMEIDCGTDVVFEGTENIALFNSSQWAERGFCRSCGSHLFYHLKETNQHMMQVGLFDDDEAFQFTHQVFVDEKPAYYSFANHTEDMTGAEVFAKFAPPSA
ncbi:GFA family protein [Paremcibacter congregatus]|uniref:Aldehyde-activating protein n=1 Tax=Paremcibacter congregatus TaxID=2043170 RepID=A0A2G4YTD1_9PROT|nr:GFA family protein [Paremcibacter congregatus]PHZ85547.1 aldehyde-activating protein [Paremcibacter congregatus]QDE26507.1 GFA family protein [Paremcibacter congregatus]